jgi:hypothetical protein
MFCGRPKMPLPMIEPTTSATSRPSPRPGRWLVRDLAGTPGVSPGWGTDAIDEVFMMSLSL